MRLDLDPEKNRAQFEQLRTFSNSGNMMLRKGFYLFLGFCLLAFGLFAVLSSQDFFKLTGAGLTQRQSGTISILLGVAVIGACYLVPKLFREIGQYQPRENTGKEWEK